MFYLWDFTIKVIPNNSREPCILIALQSICPVVVFIELIIAGLVVHVQQDQEKGCDPYGKAQDVNGGSDFIAPENAQRSDEEVS